LIVFATDTFILKNYKDYYSLHPIRKFCYNIPAYFLIKEYWPNGNIKQDRSWKWKKGCLLHGETIFYNEDGTIQEIRKYRNGKRR
jgi:hypothetical protein